MISNYFRLSWRALANLSKHTLIIYKYNLNETLHIYTGTISTSFQLQHLKSFASFNFIPCFTEKRTNILLPIPNFEFSKTQ